MGVIEEIHEDLETEVDLEEFREAVEERVERMGGLADDETAAMLVAHELEEAGGEVDGVAEIEPEMEEVKFEAKVVSVGELRTFERDTSDPEKSQGAEDPETSDAAEEEEESDDTEEGRVLNAEVADETGQVRISFWDGFAADAAERLERGDDLRIAGRPADGYRGLEVSVDKAEPADDVDIEVDLDGTTQIEDLTLGRSDVNVAALVLDTESVRTFDRDDGSEGKVANLTLGDPTGRVRATLWDGMADRAEELEPGTSVEVVDGYVREREGDLELHVGERGAIEELEESIEYTPESTPIGEVELEDQVDLVGVVRSTDPKRTFDRDDGSEGQVRNVRVQDDTGDIRVALWGEKADIELSPGDEVALADVEIQDGWQDDLEASAGWQSAVTVLEREEGMPAGGGGTADGDAALSSFGEGEDGGEEAGEDADGSTADEDEADESGDGSDRPAAEAAAATAAAGGADSSAGTGSAEEAAQSAGTDAGQGTATDAAATEEPVVAVGEVVEFTGLVVQAGDPIILDDGDATVRVDADADVNLGTEVTVRGMAIEGDRIQAEDVF